MKKAKVLLVLAMVVFAIATFTACNADLVKGNYTNGDEVINITSVESDKATANVRNLSLPNYGIYNYSADGIAISIYLTDSNDSNLKFFRSTINGKNIEGTFHLKNCVITISGKQYKK